MKVHRRKTHPLSKKDERLHEVRQMKDGSKAEIVDYKNNANIMVHFINSNVYKKTSYQNFENGAVSSIYQRKGDNKKTGRKNMTDRIGMRRKMHNGQIAEIVDYRTAVDMDIKFDDGPYVCGIRFADFQKGHILNPQEILEKKSHVGEIVTQRNGHQARLERFINTIYVEIAFLPGGEIQNTTYDNFIAGLVKYQKLHEGEKEKLPDGRTITIINYQSTSSLDIKFSDGTVLKNRSYVDFRSLSCDWVGHNKKEKVGITLKMTAANDEKATVIAYRSAQDLDVQFEDGTIRKHVTSNQFLSGAIKNPNLPEKEHTTAELKKRVYKKKEDKQQEKTGEELE